MHNVFINGLYNAGSGDDIGDIGDIINSNSDNINTDSTDNHDNQDTYFAYEQDYQQHQQQQQQQQQYNRPRTNTEDTKYNFMQDAKYDKYDKHINRNYQEVDVGVALGSTGSTGSTFDATTVYQGKEGKEQKEKKQEGKRDNRFGVIHDSKHPQQSQQYTFPITNFGPVSFADDISVDLANLCLDDNKPNDCNEPNAFEHEHRQELRESLRAQLKEVTEDEVPVDIHKSNSGDSGGNGGNGDGGGDGSKSNATYVDDTKRNAAAGSASSASANRANNASASGASNASASSARNAFTSTNTAAWRFLKRNCYRRTKARRDESSTQPKYRSYLNRGNEKASYSTEANITTANKLLDELLPPRSSVQVRLHEAYIRSCAPHIVGFSTWGKIRNKWLRKWKMKDSNLACLLLAPRRFGKSISTAMFGALLMYICPFLTTAILSTNQMMSQILMRMIISFYVQWPRSRDRILKANQEEFIVRLPDDDFKLTNAQVLASGRYNILRARASTVQSNKGVTAGVWFLDEASRINEMVLQEVVFPTLSVTYTVMLAITTPLNSNNYYSQLFERPDTSECFIKVNINLYCDDCKQKGIDPRLCRHLDYLRPSWMNSDAIDRVRPLMSPEMFAREMMAAITSADSALFSVEIRRQLRSKAPASLMRWKETMAGPEICFTFFDPAGKGESEGALASVVLTSNREVIICGLATCPLPNATQVDCFIKNYVSDLVKIDGLKNAQHLLIVERNLGPIYIDQAMLSFSEVCEDVECYEGSTGSGRSGSTKQGTWTTRMVIERACETLQFDLLAGSIYFADEMVLQDQGKTKPHEIMDKFFQQLGQIKKDKDGKYTGKHNGKQDDLFMAFVFAVYWGRQTLRKWENEAAALDSREEYLSSIFAVR